MNNSATENQACGFPATALRAYRAEVVAQVEELERCGRDISAEVRPHMEAVLRIDQLRMAHEEISGCKCWYASTEESS